MKYEPLPFLSNETALEILKNANPNELKVLPFSLGEYCEDWKFAQDICIELLNSPHLDVRVNAVCELSYIARNHKMLEKKRIESIIFRTYRNPANQPFKDDISISIHDIYMYMNWKPSLRVLPNWIAYKRSCIPEYLRFIGLCIKDYFKKR